MNEAHQIEAMLEAMIFLSREPLTPEKMLEHLNGSDVLCDMSDVKRAMRDLLTKWADEHRVIGRGLALQQLGGGYIFSTTSLVAPVVKTFVDKKPAELTKSQIEVLAIVAYRQPITRVDVDEVRGVDSSHSLKRLLELKLLKILGKSEGLGRPLLYGTTKYFLEFFSLNSLNDLPTLKQFESLGQGDEVEPDLSDARVSIKDLFQPHDASMFSKEVTAMSDDALKSLDEALLRMEAMEKKPESEG